MEKIYNDMELQGEKMELPHTPPTSNRLSNVELDKRIAKCGELRYKIDHPITQTKWVQYCKDTYGDKSVPTYLTYWMKAKEQYEMEWRGKLDALLIPAQNHLRQLLEDPNPSVRQRAIDQIMKYSGNDIQKHHVLTQDISIGFGEE